MENKGKLIIKADMMGNFSNLGTSVISFYDHQKHRFRVLCRVFCADNFQQYQKKLAYIADVIFTFEEINRLNVLDKKSYEIWVEIWVIEGLVPEYQFEAVIDYCLQDIRRSKLFIDKVTKEGCLNDPKKTGVLIETGTLIMR